MTGATRPSSVPVVTAPSSSVACCHGGVAIHCDESSVVNGSNSNRSMSMLAGRTHADARHELQLIVGKPGTRRTRRTTPSPSSS
jgi:hypothetical protein